MKRASIGVALVLAGFFAGLVLTGRLRTAGETFAQSSQRAGQAIAVPAALTGGLPDLTGIAAQAVKGVVNISSVTVTQAPRSPFSDDPFFQYFFGGQEEMFGGRDRRDMSLGSGVLVSSDGYVVTNNHVVRSAKAEVTVAFGDRHEVAARIVGTDPATDIALLKIAPGSVPMPTMTWGDSSKLKVAEWVLAIGSPYQLNQTVTLGIVSALGRTNVGFSEYEDFIQTDAAINPGNSGGALVNARGELVGINTGIVSPNGGGNQGIGFAVPSNLTRRVIGELIKFGSVRRGSVGVMYLYPLTTQLAAEIGVRETRGALVNQIDRRSPAYRAGLQPGDVIVSFNGQAVNDPSHFLRLVADAQIGSTSAVGIIRDGRAITLQIPILQREG
ncbi:MAG: trypsin-like peptidase domain-containing protein [Vicinamibacterales bacterium]|nr:trypsin-like peptidase domain-containing protein [Vicinamibacterales bacterium]